MYNGSKRAYFNVESGDEMGDEKTDIELEKYSKLSVKDGVEAIIAENGLSEYCKKLLKPRKPKKKRERVRQKKDKETKKKEQAEKSMNNVSFNYDELKVPPKRLNSFYKSDVQDNEIFSNGKHTKFDNFNYISKYNDSTKLKGEDKSRANSNDVNQSKHIKFDDDKSIKTNDIKKNKHIKFDDDKKIISNKIKNLKKETKEKFEISMNNIPFSYDNLKVPVKNISSDNISSKKSKRMKPETPMLSNSPEDQVPILKRRKVDEEKNLPIGDSPAANVSENEPSVFNDVYASKIFRKQLKKTWLGKSNEPMEVEGGHVLTWPFNCCHLPHFLCNPSLLKRLVLQLKGVEMLHKSNDMYKFHQSRELPSSGACGELRTLLTSRVRPWLARATAIPLNDVMDLSVSLYRPSDCLLCHDDELEGRRIAFILYLSEWETGNGGSLDLFSVDEKGNPDLVVKRLYPQYNTFAFFEVSPVSYHQVSEVFKGGRLSVAGWFHGPPISRPAKPLPSPRCFVAPRDVSQEILYAWINPLYLAESAQASVRRQFVADSEIELVEFLNPEKFDALAEEVRGTPKEAWVWAGPPNRSRYQHLKKISTQTAEFLQIMRSEAMFLVISQLTGLTLHPLYKEEEENNEVGNDNFLSSDSDEEESGSEKDDDESGPEKLVTLKSLLKQVKTELSSDFSKKSVLKSAWTEDTGYASGDNECKDSKTGNNSDDKSKTIKKKYEKTKVSSPVAESSSSVYASVRQISHGCYSLVLDDNNISAKADDIMAKTDAIADQADVRTDNDAINAETDVLAAKTSDTTGNDSDEEGEGFALDACLYMNVPDDWREEYGGSTVYIAKNDGNVLMQDSLRNNTLSLVYRDSATFPFMKHVNCKAGRRKYNAVALQYKGK